MPKPPPDSIPLTSVRGAGQSSTLLPPGSSHENSTTFSDSTRGSSSDLVHLSKDTSRQPSPFAELPHPDQYRNNDRESGEDGGEDSDFEQWEVDGGSAHASDMPSDLRPSMEEVKSSHHQPLLAGDKARQSYDASYDGERPGLSQSRRSSRFRERDSDDAATMTRKRYTYAAGFLLLSLITFAIQTETAVYIQHNLGWKKAYCML